MNFRNLQGYLYYGLLQKSNKTKTYIRILTDSVEVLFNMGILVGG